jgi:hypothetical protein
MRPARISAMISSVGLIATSFFPDFNRYPVTNIQTFR